MTSLYKIRLVYEPHPIPEAPEFEAAMPMITQEEVVFVEAKNLVQAAKKSMAYNKIHASGRLVRYFDELGAEIYTF